MTLLHLYVIIDPSFQLKTFDSLVRELQTTITSDNKDIHPLLPHINALLQNAVLTTRAVASSDIMPSTAFNREKIAPGKNLEHQWRFHKTTKEPGRKRKGLVLRYSHANLVL